MNPRSRGMTVVGAAGVAWGGLLLLRGDIVWRRVAGSAPTPHAAWAVRVLGLRHLLQGIAQTVWPWRWARLWVAVDATHAATMLPLAVVGGPSRRPALLSAVVAAAGAGTVAATLRRSSR